MFPNGNSWSVLSDRKAKEHFAEVDGRQVLEKLSTVPVSTWNYKAQGSEIRHIGPIAQDFYAAFQVGEDERYISTVDADGVALAAIQGLYELLQEKQEYIASQQAQIDELAEQNDRLAQRLAALEKQVGSD